MVNTSQLLIIILVLILAAALATAYTYNRQRRRPRVPAPLGAGAGPTPDYILTGQFFPVNYWALYWPIYGAPPSGITAQHILGSPIARAGRGLR